MNITTRGLDKDVINIIDSKAKKQNISRNEYIKKLITYDSNNYALKLEKKELEVTVSKINKLLEQNQKGINNIENLFENIYILNAVNLNMTLDELDEEVKKHKKSRLNNEPSRFN